MVSLVVVFVNFFSFTCHPFSFNHSEVVEVAFVEEAEDEESIVILEKVVVVKGTSSSLSLQKG